MPQTKAYLPLLDVENVLPILSKISILGGLTDAQIFVVFRNASTGAKRAHRTTSAAPVPVRGPWEIRFPAGWGAPESIRMERLISWPELTFSRAARRQPIMAVRRASPGWSARPDSILKAFTF